MTSDDHWEIQLGKETEGTGILLRQQDRRELVNVHGIGVLHTNANSPSRGTAFEELI
jgi:hypothetical protein